MRKMLVVVLFVVLNLVQHLVLSQNVLVWSEDFETQVQSTWSDVPSLQINNDTIQVIGPENLIGQRLLIVNYNLNGDTLSTITYGSDSVSNNYITDYKFDQTGCVYLLHKEQLESYKSKIVLQKYTAEGNLLWVQQIQNAADTSFTPVALAIINDTSVFVLAYREYDYPLPDDDVIFTTTHRFIYSFHSNGAMNWLRELPQVFTYFNNPIIPYNNTALIFGGGINKVTLDGVVSNYSMNTLNGINNIQLTPDNNLLVTSFTKYRITKVSLSGTVIWTRYYGTNLPDNVSGDEIKSVIQDSGGNIYLTGRHYGDEYGTSNYTNADILTLKYNSNGTLQWQNRYEFEINNADIGSFITLKNGYVYVGGESQRLGVTTDYDYVVLKIDATSGEHAGVYRYNGFDNGDDVVTSISVFNDGSVALTGLSLMGSMYNWTTQLLSDVIISTPEIENNQSITLFPNPATTEITVQWAGSSKQSEVTIYNTQGQLVLHSIFDIQHSTFDISSFPSGLYYLQLFDAKGTLVKTEKVVKE